MEPLFGYMKLALEVSNDPATFSGAWNFGPYNHDSLAVNQLADMAISAWGKGKLTIKEDRSAPHEAHYLRLDISKAIGELGWLPRMKVNDAVQRTIQWYKAFYDGAKATDLIDEDLKYYESLHN
jgi:CDP-glucose 4,6-dehydratase